MKKDEIMKHLARGRGEFGSWLLREDSDALRNRILGLAAYKPILERLSAEGDRFLAAPIPDLPWTLFRRVWEDGNRKTYEAVYFHRRQRLSALGLLSWLYPERADYRDTLLDTVWAICHEFSWCIPTHFANLPGNQPLGNPPLKRPVLMEDMEERDPAIGIDLFAAETAFALAEVLQLTGGAWPEAVIGRVYRETFLRVFRPFLSDAFFWEEVRNNWAAVCAGSIGAAAIHLLEDPEELAQVLNKALPTIDLFLEGFGEDGVCLEGYMYWGYGFGFYTYFAELLHRRTDGGIDMFAPPKVKEIALFQQKSFLSGRKVVNFSDSIGEADVYIGLSHELIRRFPEMHVPEFTFADKPVYDHCGRWAPALRNLIWYEDGLRGGPWETASYYLPDAQWLVSRAEHEDERFCFAAKGGYNDEPHNHNDIGHFILTAGEDTFLADIGCGVYTLQYFGPNRYSFICNGAQGHSVPSMGDNRQLAGPAYKAAVLQAETGETCDRFGLELKEAYGHPTLLKLERSWTWRKDGAPPWLSVEDLFVFSEDGEEITDRFICAKQPVVTSAGRVELNGAHYKLAILFDESVLEPAVEELKLLDHFGREVLFYALDLKGRYAGSGTEYRLRVDFRFERRDSAGSVQEEDTNSIVSS